MDWLNGPLVWAIEEAWQSLYLFPRDCPRMLLTPKQTTSAEDLAKWFLPGSSRMIAYVERAWLERISTTILYRYELPDETFQSLDDAGMWVSKRIVIPKSQEALTITPSRLATEGVELRGADSLLPLQGVWSSSLHVSGIRLRNAQAWPANGATSS